MRYDEINLKGLYIGLKVCAADAKILSDYIKGYDLVPVNPLHMTLVKLLRGKFNFANPPRLNLPITLKASSFYGFARYDFKGIMLGFEGSRVISEWLQNEATAYVKGNGMALGNHDLSAKWKPHISLTYETNKIPEPRRPFPLHNITFDEMMIEPTKPNWQKTQGG